MVICWEDVVWLLKFLIWIWMMVGLCWMVWLVFCFWFWVMFILFCWIKGKFLICIGGILRYCWIGCMKLNGWCVNCLILKLFLMVSVWFCCLKWLILLLRFCLMGIYWDRLLVSICDMILMLWMWWKLGWIC